MNHQAHVFQIYSGLKLKPSSSRFLAGGEIIRVCGQLCLLKVLSVYRPTGVGHSISLRDGQKTPYEVVIEVDNDLKPIEAGKSFKIQLTMVYVVATYIDHKKLSFES